MSGDDRDGGRSKDGARGQRQDDAREDDQHAQLDRMRLLAMRRRQVQRKAARRAEGDAKIPTTAGAPLSSEVRARMEPAIGADLSQVKVHTGGDSAAAADRLGARAFTTGSDVHFGAGEFAPQTKEGDRLLGHELAHVVQGQRSGIQRKAAPDGQDAQNEDGGVDVSEPGEPAENEADAVGDHVADKLHGKAEAHGAAANAGSERATAIGAKLQPGTIPLAKKGDDKKDDKKKPPENRGRLQVQGKDLDPELSWPWAGPDVPTAEQALSELEKMKAKLTKNQLAIRNEAFDSAAKFIRQAKVTGGVDAPVSQSYQNKNLRPNEKTARVDIEVRTGKAFV